MLLERRFGPAGTDHRDRGQNDDVFQAMGVRVSVSGVSRHEARSHSGRCDAWL